MISAFIGDILIDNYCDSLVLAIRALNYARTLSLSGHLVWALTSARIRLSTKFDRLEELKIDVPCSCYHVSVLDFIQCSDNLQILTHMMDCFAAPHDLPNLPNRRNPENIPICLSNSLKIVTLMYDGCGYDMADYMLQNGDIMELMEIEFVGEHDPKVARDISEIPRKSPTCEVEFFPAC